MKRPNDLLDRTKAFALATIKFREHLPKDETSRILDRQLLRSGTSVGANYRAAHRAKSKADFISKMGSVLEEADESAYWIELLIEAGKVKSNHVRISISGGERVNSDCSFVNQHSAAELRFAGLIFLLKNWAGGFCILRSAFCISPRPFQQRTNTSCYLAIPTHGFTVVLSVFGGTPPAKPLICKSVSNHFGVLISNPWADPTGGKPRLSCPSSVANGHKPSSARLSSTLRSQCCAAESPRRVDT